MNRYKLDRKGRTYKKVDRITYVGMRYYDEIRKSFTNLSSKGNLNRYYKAGIS